MPAVTMPARQKGDFLVDYERRFSRTSKPSPARRRWSRFTRSRSKARSASSTCCRPRASCAKVSRPSILLYGPGVTLGMQRGFPKLGGEAFPGHLVSTRRSASSWPKAARSTPAGSRSQALYGQGEPSLIPGITPINPLDVLDLILIHRKDERVHPPHLDPLGRVGSAAADGARSTWPRSERSRRRGADRARARTAAPGRVDRVCAADRGRPRARGRSWWSSPRRSSPTIPYFSFVQPPVAMGAGAHAPLRGGGRRARSRDRGGGRGSARDRRRGGARRQRARPRLALQRPARSSTPTAAGAQPAQDHADLSRAHDLGPGRRLRAQGGRHARSGGSARWPAGSTTTRSPATR